MKQRTLKLDDVTIVYCYEDGSVEWYTRSINEKVYKCITFGCKNGNGYLKIRIKNKDYFVHKLIALSFIPNPKNYKIIDHINRNKSDNRPCNLRWCDYETNNNNRSNVDKAIDRDGFRCKDDKNRYQKLHDIIIRKPNGKCSSISITEDERKILTPLTQKERYFKLKEIRDAVKE